MIKYGKSYIKKGSLKSLRKIPKGVIHIQASCNNTILTVTHVRGASGFLMLRRYLLLPRDKERDAFAAKTVKTSAIRAIVDGGMQRAKIMTKGPGLERDTTLRTIHKSGI